MKNDMGVLLLWLGRKLARNHEALITKMDAIQNLFETSAEATATPSDIMEGKTAYNGTILMTGTMENQGTKEATLLAGGTYSIPRGYHNGAGRVAAADLASQTAGTATAGGMLSGLKAWVAGKAINGTMKDRRGVTVTASTVTQDDEYTYLTVPEEACYSASSKVRTKNSNISKVNTGTLTGGAKTITTSRKPSIIVAHETSNDAFLGAYIVATSARLGYAVIITKNSDTSYNITNGAGNASNFEYWWA